MQRLRVEVVVEVEVEEVQSYRSIRVSWQRTITGYVVRRPIRGGVFDRPESIVEVQVNDQTGP